MCSFRRRKNQSELTIYFSTLHRFCVLFKGHASIHGVGENNKTLYLEVVFPTSYLFTFECCALMIQIENGRSCFNFKLIKR